MIDRTLNYGRDIIKRYLKTAMPYKSVLDIGAGRGDDLAAAREINASAELFAVEIHDKNLVHLKSFGVRAESIDIERDRFPFEDNTMDVIIGNQILEHTKELFWIFHEITRILPIGGKLIIGVPNLASLHNRLLLAIGRQPSPIKSNSAHIRGFTKQDLLSFLTSCFPRGYKLKAFSGSNFYPFPPIISKLLAKIFPNMAWGIFLLFEKNREYQRQFLEYPQYNRLETNFWMGQSV